MLHTTERAIFLKSSFIMSSSAPYQPLIAPYCLADQIHSDTEYTFHNLAGPYYTKFRDTIPRN